MLTQKRKNEQKAKRRPAFQSSPDSPRSEKQKRKRGLSPGTTLETMSGWQRLKYFERKRRDGEMLILLAMLQLAALFCHINGRLVEWRDWQLLEKHGELQSALLVETGSYQCSRDRSCYYAEYSYHHIIHKQDISAARYEELQGASRIAVIAHEDLARLPGSKPNFWNDMAGSIVWGAITLALFGWGLRKGWRANLMQNARY